MKILVIILIGGWSKISQGGGGSAGGIWTHYLSISKVLAMAPLPETCACVYLIGQYRWGRIVLQVKLLFFLSKINEEAAVGLNMTLKFWGGKKTACVDILLSYPFAMKLCAHALIAYYLCIVCDK